MEALQQLMMGFSIAITPVNLLYCLLGTIAGTIIGALPGIGPSAGISILLPLTFGVNPTSAMIMMAGIYCGAMYGGTITSVLINLPGESSSVMTTLDGYQMALQGRAGTALGIAAFGSFIAGTASVIFLMLIAVPLVKVALSFGPPEYFALMLMGLTTISGLTGGSVLKAFLVTFLGLLVSTSGMDALSGHPRLTFDFPELLDGVNFLVVAVGLFGIGEVLFTAEKTLKLEFVTTTIRGVWPNREDWRLSWAPITRGTFIGFIVGVLPGAGGTIASFLSYATEKKLSRHPERFGKGAIEGVAGPESANNSVHRRRHGAAAHAGDPGLRDHRHHAGGTDDVRPAAGSFALPEEPGFRLGRHRKHVHRQCHASHHEHRLHPSLRQDSQDPQLRF